MYEYDNTFSFKFLANSKYLVMYILSIQFLIFQPTDAHRAQFTKVAHNTNVNTILGISLSLSFSFGLYCFATFACDWSCGILGSLRLHLAFWKVLSTLLLPRVTKTLSLGKISYGGKPNGYASW
jgi:hypothetical protein